MENETTIRCNIKTDLPTHKENVLPKISSERTENGIIEQLHKEIISNDWSKYFKTIKEEEK